MTGDRATRRSRVLGVEVDVIDQVEATTRVMALTRQAAALVVTVNLDHAVRLRRNAQLSNLYREADVVLADGFPLVLASRLRGPALPERVTGADLIEPVCREASRAGASIFIVGTTLAILCKACRHLSTRFPGLSIVGVHAPSFGFHKDHPESEEVAAMMRAATPDIVFVALGSPKQELWARAHMHRLPPAVYICTGAGFDYLAGKPRRAPQMVRRLCLEWLWRLAREPRRLAKRYALDMLQFPPLLVEHLGWLQRAATATEADRASARLRPYRRLASADRRNPVARR